MTFDDDDIIYLYDDDDVLNKYHINPSNLYSFHKKFDIKKIGGTTDLSLFSSSHIRNISPFEATKINDFIIFYFHLLNRTSSSRTKIGFIKSFLFNSIRYFIEFSVKNNKLIISINYNRSFTDELIHLSCFTNSFIHISFFYSGNKYRLYYKNNPDKNNKFNDILNFILDCNNNIFDDFENVPLHFWNSDWQSIINDNRLVFQENLLILLKAIRFLIDLSIFRFP